MQEYVGMFHAYAKEYPWITLWALGTLSWVGRFLPKHIIVLAEKHLTTKVTMMNSSEVFHNYIRWFEKQDISKNLRSLKFSNGRWGGDASTKSIGYGVHYFFYDRTLIRMDMATEPSNSVSDREKDTITLRKLGRSHDVFNKLFNEIAMLPEEKDKIILKTFNGDHWVRDCSIRKRGFDTVFLRDGVEEILKEFLDDFKNKEKLHLALGVPHQTAILLDGPPGTGKTSIAKCIASYLNSTIHDYPVSQFYSIKKAFSRLEEYSLVLIEDIDTDPAVISREQEPPQDACSGESGISYTTKKPKTGISLVDKEFTLTNMSDILNAIDGLKTTHGRVLIATTNHPDNLDPALIRDGRFNLRLTIDYADRTVVEKFAKKFFPGEVVPEWFKLKPETASATISKIGLRNHGNFDKFIKELHNGSDSA